MILILIIATLVIGFIFHVAEIDYEDIKVGNTINHDLGWRTRALALATIGLPIALVDWVSYLVYLPLVAVIFWIGFDLRLNYLRDKDWLYVGYNAKTDLFFRKHFPGSERFAMAAAKVVAFLILFSLFVYVYNVD